MFVSSSFPIFIPNPRLPFMASARKSKSEGIALLSMYGEDDEEMEDLEEEEEQQQQAEREEGEVQEKRVALDDNENEYCKEKSGDRGLISDSMVTDELAVEQSTPAAVTDRNSTQKNTPKPPTEERQQRNGGVGDLEAKRRGRGRLTIVDYAHDELALSPEPEEGEWGEDLPDSNGAFKERTSSGNVQVLTPNNRATPPLSDHIVSPHPDEVNLIESEAVETEVTMEVPIENVDPLDKFLPPPPKEKCPEGLQKRIDKFLALKQVGRSFNAEVRNRKDYRNPDFLLHAVRYQDIDQIGSCFCKDVFDPHGYDKSDYYDEIEADMRRDRERKEQELKTSSKVEFVSGGSQTGALVPPAKLGVPIPAVVSTGSIAAQAIADAFGRDGRQNKKSKWDKVDGDVRNPLQTSGQILASVAAHATLLSASNVGTGYSAFVQQKRREAEENRSSERKLERRS